MTTAVRLWDLDTPTLVVDVDRLEHNVAAAAGALRDAGIALRPHVKTSKCLEVARRQVEAGAIGHTCSTPAEVEYLTDGGFTGLLWAHLPVGAHKVDFAVSRARDHGLLLLVDSIEVARPLSDRAAAEGVEVRFLLEVDTGHGRTGSPTDEAVRRADLIASLPGMSLAGVLTHEGHLSSYGRDRARLTQEARASAGRLVEVAESLRAAGHACPTVSVGSTPGLDSAPFVEGVTEARPGTYVYFDANQFRLGSNSIDDCALTVLARVVSVRGDQAIVDAGLKAMSSDSLTPENGVGIVCDLAARPLGGVEFWTANEEHGFLRGPGVAHLAVGDVLRIVPNHACGTTNMWSRLHAVHGETAEESWHIGGRH